MARLLGQKSPPMHKRKATTSLDDLDPKEDPKKPVQDLIAENQANKGQHKPISKLKKTPLSNF